MINHTIKYLKDVERDGDTLRLIGAVMTILFIVYVVGVFMGASA